MFSNMSKLDQTALAPAEMKLGDKGLLPTAAVVVSRFPKL
jgi:hypothetical protein